MLCSVEPWDSTVGHEGFCKKIGGNGGVGWEAVSCYCWATSPDSALAQVAHGVRGRGSVAEGYCDFESCSTRTQCSGLTISA